MLVYDNKHKCKPNLSHKFKYKRISITMCENVFLSHLHIKWGAPSVSGITPFTLVIPKSKQLLAVQALTHHQEHLEFETAFPLRLILAISRRLFTKISAFPGQVE
ncbi:hypothetical protein G6F43_013494 [Rhizopus delemar]|nr:hypothetical protein G6F43_013494 [Rhizopus delemar]